MAQVVVATPARDTYWGAIVGGYIVGGSGSIMLLILAVTGVVSDHTIPGGLIGLALGLLIIGAAVVVTAYPMRSMAAVMARLDEHQADHMAAALDTQDLVVVKNKATDTATEVHELHQDTGAMKVVLLRIAQYLVRHQTPSQREDAFLEEVVARLSGVEEDVAALVNQAHTDQGASVLPFPGGSNRKA